MLGDVRTHATGHGSDGGDGSGGGGPAVVVGGRRLSKLAVVGVGVVVGVLGVAGRVLGARGHQVMRGGQPGVSSRHVRGDIHLRANASVPARSNDDSCGAPRSR